MTTVAYGDVVPVTVPGKIIAVMLMFAGIGILWTYVAAVASKLVAERVGKKETRSEAADQSNVSGLENTENVEMGKKIRQKEYDVLADMIATFKNLEQRDYDELIDIIKSLKDNQSTIQKE
jgi:voltage-gated potassium channel